MPLTYINPNADLFMSGLTTALPAYAQINDMVNEATWVEFDPGGAAELGVGFANFTIPGTNRIKSVRLIVNLASFSGIFLESYMYNDDGAPGVLLAGVTVAGAQPGTIIAYSPMSQAPGGGEWTQTAINRLAVHFHKASTITEEILFDATVEIDHRVKPTVDGISGPTGAQSTRKPTVNFTRTIGDGQSQKKYQIKVFSSTVYGAGGFNPDTSPHAYSATVLGGGTSHTLASMIGDGTFKAYVRVAKDFNGSDWYSDWFTQPGTFTITDPPPLPTNITPSSSAVVTTDRPILGGTINAPTLQARSRIEWNMATDAGFTTNLKAVIEPLSDVRLSGPTTEITSSAAELFQTTWYIRARQVDEFGTPSSGWTTAHTFTVTHPPSSSNHVPTGSQTVGWGVGASVTVQHDWKFTDPSPYDNQTAYQLVSEYNDTGSIYVDTGKITSTQDIHTQNYDGLVREKVMRWKVKTWDSDDVSGAYSDYHLFIPADPPITTITQPASGGDFGNPNPVVIWSSIFGGSRFQQSYRVTIGLGESLTNMETTPFYDSGWRVSTAQTHDVMDQILEHNISYWVKVEVRDNSGLFGSDQNFFRAFWDLPLTPTLELYLEDIKEHGYVTLVWNSDNIDDDFVRYELRRRDWSPGPDPAFHLRVDGNGQSTTPYSDVFRGNEVDVRIRLSMDDLTFSAFDSQELVKHFTTNNFAWAFGLENNTGGIAAPKLFFGDSTNGTSGNYHYGASTTAMVGMTEQQEVWLRCRFVGDNGAGQNTKSFYWSTDRSDDDTAVDWIFISTTTTAGTRDLFDSVAQLQVADFFAANIYAMALYINGVKVANPTYRDESTPVLDAQGHLWTNQGDAHQEAEPVPPNQLGEWTLLESTTAQQDRYEIEDWLVGNHRAYEWALTQVALRFDIEVPAIYHRIAGESTADDYWLIHPSDSSLSIKLHHVSEESFKEEFEQEISHILGRGRHQDMGERFGYSGELSGQLWDRHDGLTGRQQRQKLEALKATKSDLYLRNPFGDIFRVAPGDIEFDREAGVGSGDREFSGYTISYTEVFDA